MRFATIRRTILRLLTLGACALPALTVRAQSADQEIFSVSDSPDPVTAGSNVTYTITVRNYGPNDATNGGFNAALGTGLTFVSATSDDFSCSPSGQNVSCTTASFGAGFQYSATIVATVSAALSGGTVVSTSFSTSGTTPDPNNANNTSTSSTTVSALPVELVSFAASANGRAALLRWETMSETNNAGFHVEQHATLSDRSAPWRELAFVAGRGTTAERTTYAHTVSGLTPGTYSFRLRQVDFDGTTSYSPTVEVTVGLDGASLVEVRGQTVRFAVRESQAVRAELFNVMGQRLATPFDGEAQAGRTTTVEVPEDLGAGVYLVRLTGRSFAETARIVVL